MEKTPHERQLRAIRRRTARSSRFRHRRTAALHETHSRQTATASAPNAISYPARETIAFSKRHQSVAERAAWLTLWLNFGRRFSENHGGGTPAMRLGLTDRPIPIHEMLEQRLFPARVQLPEPWVSYCRGEIRTSRIANERRHTFTLAA